MKHIVIGLVVFNFIFVKMNAQNEANLIEITHNTLSIFIEYKRTDHLFSEQCSFFVKFKIWH